MQHFRLNYKKQQPFNYKLELEQMWKQNECQTKHLVSKERSISKEQIQIRKTGTSKRVKVKYIILMVDQ
jgi:hypothetical protein